MKEKDIKNYKLRQKIWVKANNLKIGNKVMLLKPHKGYTKGWNMPWVLDKSNEKYFNTPLRVTNIHPKMGIEVMIPEQTIFGTTYTFVYLPYTVLQKVENFYWCKPKGGNYEWEKHPIEMFWKKNPNYSYSFVNPYE